VTEAQITQIIGILSLLATTINAFVLFWIANHQRGVAEVLAKQNGALNEALTRINPPGENVIEH
jgi:hypothetical protein